MDDVVVENVQSEDPNPNDIILIAYVDPKTHKVEPVQMLTRERATDFFVMLEKINHAKEFKTYKLTETEL